MAARPRDRAVGADALVVAIFGLFGLRLGLNRLSDNSGFTHLATGIRMVAHGVLPAIPRVDPYTFTAHGKPWVVQSWLAEAGVGWAYRFGGQHAVMLLSGGTVALCAALLAILGRTGRPLGTVAAAVPPLLISFPEWSGRPLLVGLLALGLTILIVERKWSPYWLVPLVWVWVNCHGSFPLGAAWIGLTVLGCWIDRKPAPLRYASTFLGGLAVSVINPLGPKLLAFPAVALTKSDVFKQVVEWRSPNFQTTGGTLALVGIVVSVALLARSRLSWAEALPLAVFLGLALQSMRNLAPLGFVVAPVLGRALTPDPDAPARAPLSPAFVRATIASLAVIGLVFSLAAIRAPLVDASSYPVAQIVWLEQHHRFDAPHRVAEEDTVGNYIELRHGPRGDVFIDDRVDMFPVSVVNDEVAMHDGLDRGVRALDRWGIDTILWRTGTPFAQRLTASGRWTSAVRHKGYVVLVRRTD